MSGLGGPSYGWCQVGRVFAMTTSKSKREQACKRRAVGDGFYCAEHRAEAMQRVLRKARRQTTTLEAV